MAGGCAKPGQCVYSHLVLSLKNRTLTGNALRRNSAKSQCRSSAKGALENALKVRHRTRRSREHRLKMSHRLRERIDAGTRRRLTSREKHGAQDIEPSTQSTRKMIERLQGEMRVKRLDSALQRTPRKQQTEQSPNNRRGDTVARHYSSQENRERLTASAAPPTIAAKDPLPPEHAGVSSGGIVAVKKAVAVERAGALAMRATPMLERKRVRKQRLAVGNEMKRERIHPPLLPKIHASRREIPRRNGNMQSSPAQRRFERRNSFQIIFEKGRAALTALPRPSSDRNLASPYDPITAQKRHFLRRHCGH